MKINTSLLPLARDLRKNNTLSERILWKELQGKKLGFKFIRQQPVGRYIVDFLCRKENVVIEIDGDSHDGKLDYDNVRDEFLKSQGLVVIHIHDHEVKKNIGGVLKFIKDSIATRTSSSVVTRY